MAKSSGTTRAAPLKTYSRRVNITTERPPGKRKISEDSQIIVELPPAKKSARSSIQSYFQPLSSSSSPAPTRSALQSPDSLERRLTPPSSPPSRAASSLILERRSQKRPKRRLSTKPKSVATTMMSSSCDHCIEKCDCSSRDSEPADSSPIPCRPSPCKFTVPVTDYRLLTQTQLSFGNGPTIEECKLCDTRYNPTIPYDVQMHADRHVEAVTFDSDSINFSEVTIGSHGIGLDRLLYIKVTRYDASRVRSFAARVVDKVDGELGVKSENLWGPNQRFQVFIVMLNGQPIGALVAVPIVKAGRYSREYELDEFGPLKEDLSKEVVSTSINMCVDRLWVHPDHRGGITHRVHFAWRLMELAREHFIPNYHIPKCEVAFSYPSNQGYSFACKYFKGAFESDTNLKGKGVKMLVDSDEFVAPAESV